MYKKNWAEISPRKGYKGTCYIRDYFRRRDKPNLDGGMKITKYLEWVRHTTIPAEGKLLYHKKNVEEVIYILQGEGSLITNSTKHNIRANDLLYIPPETFHSMSSNILHQPIITLNFGVCVPIDAENIQIKETSRYDSPCQGVIIDQWISKKPKSEHDKTCCIR